ncbi:MAG: hypothetical protein EOP85_11195 [Verrucomicrobiaceae bacterium]|nr:MAG: hypothetical protein EOP85_11195 [Verrucomicrobiaceae bacterium]
MNFRTVLHLLKTDWKRFKIPIVGMWVVLAISSSPWLLHDPASFDLPVITGASHSGDVESLGVREVASLPVPMHLISLLALALPALLSTGIGMHDQGWQVVSPIRLWQRLLAKTLALLLFVVLPQLVPGAVISMLNGFSSSFTISHAFSSGVMLLAIHGIFAVLGRCCYSFWSWSAAMVCLTGISFLLRSVLPEVFVFSGFPGLPSGNIGIAATPRNSVPMIGALLLLSWPVLSSDGIREGSEIQRGAGRSKLQQKLLIGVNSSGQNPRTFAGWVPDTRMRRGMHYFIGSEGPEAQEALLETLPAPLFDTADNNSHSFYFDTDPGGKIPSHIPVTGFVFRFRKVADLPLGQNVVTSTFDNITVAARFRSSGNDGPLAEISVKAPLYLTGGIRSYFRYILYYPDSGKCFGLRSVYGGQGSSQGGVSWFHRLMKADDRLLQDAGALKNARLLVIQPEYLGSVSRDLGLSDVKVRPDSAPSDWMLTRDYDPRSDVYHSRLRPNRPDPAKCTEQEFSRYLRSVISLHPSPVIARDLAEYAPRFPRLLALYSQQALVAKAIESGVPESGKAEVASAVEGRGLALSLVGPLTNRDWADLVRAPFLDCLQAPPSRYGEDKIRAMVSAIARQEDPSIYPVLLKVYETTGDSGLYDVIRSLPGIGPELDKVVERISQRLSQTRSIRGEEHDFIGGFNEFRGPVSHGNATAFAKLLQCIGDRSTKFFISGELILEVIQPGTTPDTWPGNMTPEDEKTLSEILGRRSPSDFAYDPLSRCWHLISKTP